ncbi:MAG: SDR family oxidoreductase [Rubrobacteraceae bacterium]
MAATGNDVGGKVCLVTGATSGIGAVTARELGERGAKVIVVGRNREKARAMVEEIPAQSNNVPDYLLADLSSQAEIRNLVKEFRYRYDRLDVLINNAGAIFAEYGETVDGIERTFAVNHLSYFLLTNLLLDVLKASAPSRIVNVASGAHQGAELDFDDLDTKQDYRFMKAYGRSKLANVMFTYELARRLDGTGVTANALHPGAVATSFGSNNKVWYARPMLALFRLFATTPEKGAETSIYLADSPEVEGVTGQYFVNRKPVGSSRASYDGAAAERLWRASEELTGLSEEETV